MSHTSSQLSPPAVLIPKVSRRKKSSFSPVETRTPSPKPRRNSEQESVLHEVAEAPLPSSALEFNEFSCWSDEDSYNKSICKESQNALLSYLDKEFGCSDIMESGPYLFLFCNTVPDIDTRPSTIAGCVAIWLDEDEGLPPELGQGNMAGGINDIEMPEHIRQDLRPYRLPKPETLVAIAGYFSSATSITFLNMV